MWDLKGELCCSADLFLPLIENLAELRKTAGVPEGNKSLIYFKIIFPLVWTLHYIRAEAVLDESVCYRMDCWAILGKVPFEVKECLTSRTTYYLFVHFRWQPLKSLNLCTTCTAEGTSLSNLLRTSCPRHVQIFQGIGCCLMQKWHANQQKCKPRLMEVSFWTRAPSHRWQHGSLEAIS